MTERAEIRFDGWVLRPRSGELSRDGNVQRLPQQPLRVLIELLDHPGEVVTRERLIQVLWPKGVVDFDNSLNAVMRKLRVLLGDDSEAPRYIETLPRIGYRFIGTLDVSDFLPPPSTSAARSPRGRSAAVGALIAVLSIGAVAAFAWLHDSSPRQNATATSDRTDAEPRRTSNQRAYELYLNGRFHRSRRDVNGTPFAIASFQAALREDPHFAAAWAALAETYVGAAITQYSPVVETFERARSAALRAMELDPSLAAGHSTLAMIALQYDLDYAKAEAEFLAARRADEHYARTWHNLGLMRAYQGRVDEASAYLQRARELEPMTLLYAVNYGNLLYFTRRYQEAITHVRPLLASQPRFDQARAVLIRALIASGDVDAALEQLPLRYSDTPALSDEGLVYTHAGRRAEALQQVARLERRGREGYGVAYEIAIIYAALNDKTNGCVALRRAIADHSQTIGWLRLDPRLDNLRSEPCFAEVERRLYGD